MAFQIYKSSDVGAPSFYGTSGSYLMLLNYCLVSGYGSQPGAGWVKPFTDNTSSTSGTTPVFGCFQQPTGSTGTGSAGCTLFINDNYPNGTAAGREAWATGWEVLTAINSTTASAVGTGSGQFPTPAQLLTNGHCVVRKSATSDSSSLRQWVVVADSSSFYSFIATGDVASTYYGFGFGDIFSHKTGSNDAYRCIIMGRLLENSNAGNADGFDYCANGVITNPIGGNFMARSHTQIGTSITVGKHGDGFKGHATFFYGVVPMPNSVDNALYLSPVWVVENSIPAIRGQLRGFYQTLHPIANFADQQTFSGSIDYNGKTFMMIKTTPNAGIYCVETSDTLLTN